MSIMIGAITPKDTETDATAGYELNGAFGVHTLNVGAATYLYVTGHDDNGLSVFQVNSNGTLTSVQNIVDTTTLELSGASQITSATVAGGTFLYVNSALDDGLSVFKVNDNGSLTSVQNITDDDVIELNGPEGKMSVATVAGTTYLVSPADDDNGLGIWKIDPTTGKLTNVHNVSDFGELQLHSASDSVVVELDGVTYTYVAAEDDPGISAFRINANGSLVNTQNVPDDATLELAGGLGLATTVVEGTNYVVASGYLDDGLSVFAVGEGGILTNVDNVSDTPALGLDGAMGITGFKLDGESFVAVSASVDNALAVFHVGPGGLLTDVTDVFDTPGTALGGTWYNTFTVVDGRPVLIASGRNNDGVTVFDIGSGDDEISGGDDDDLLMGLAGDDTLAGGNGNDTIHGDGGSDTIHGGGGLDEAVFTGASDQYIIDDNGGGTVLVTNLVSGFVDVLSSVERLRFSDGVFGADGKAAANEAPSDIFLSSATVLENTAPGAVVGSLGAVDRDMDETFTFSLTDPSSTFALSGRKVIVAPGVQLDYESQTSYTVQVSAKDSAGHVLTEDLVIRVQNVSPSIAGFTQADILKGTSEEDTIHGNGAKDVLYGFEGDDTLYGDNGADKLIGGAGNDLLAGGADADTYVVEDAGDQILELAGQGTDTVQTELTTFSLDTAGNANVEHLTFTGTGTAAFSGTGNALANTITGGSGNDTLLGRGGNDSLKGMNGNDTLDGGGGKDTLTGGANNDVFVFNSLAEAGDVITDFTNTATNNDSFRISASAFGGDLLAGTLSASQFQSRSDNLAQDADDRFIFRTTDQTLWFDSNGNASGGLTMVADLQANATVTSADILVV